MPQAPPSPLHVLTATVLAHRHRLLSAYDPHDVHQLRVHIRRIRALMKYLPLCRDRALRAAWRELFLPSNPARDWDVFADNAETLLPPEALGSFHSAIAPILSAQRQRAVGHLSAADWTDHLEAWGGFLDTLEPPPWTLPQTVLPTLIGRVREAQRKALENGDDFAWHRLRINIKYLRYMIDIDIFVIPDHAKAIELVETCKAAQDLLGAWHDCAVQLELLDEPRTRRQLEAVREGQALRELLIRQLQERRDSLLGEAGKALSGFPE